MAAQTSSDSNKPHAVVLPFPAQGHITPMLQFAQRLASRGFRITFVNTDYNHMHLVQSMIQNGVQRFQETGLDIHLVGIPDGLPAEHGRTSGNEVMDLIVASDTSMRPEFQKLMEVLGKRDPPVTCLIADVIMSWAEGICQKFAIPSVFFWTARTATFLVYYHMPILQSKGYFPLKADAENELITCVPGLPPTPLFDLPSFLLVQNPKDYFFDWMYRMFEPITHNATDWIFVNSFYGLDTDAFDAMAGTKNILCPVGPLLPSKFLDEEDVNFKEIDTCSICKEDFECLKWLDKQLPSSVLYVSFGSIAVLSPPQIEELARGLESSKQPFLWVFRPDLVDGESSITLELLEARTGKQGLLIKWAPQLKVLSHPAVGGFLTHCGWNSTLETICTGVPTLGWPWFAEQRMNRYWMEKDLKIGMGFQAGKDGLVRREEVEKRVRALMEGEEGKKMRERACKLREEARRGLAVGHANTQGFIKSILCRMEKMKMK